MLDGSALFFFFFKQNVTVRNNPVNLPGEGLIPRHA